MNLEFERSIRILENLLSHCRELGGRRFHMELAHETDKMILVIRAEIEDLEEERLNELDEALTIPRQHEIESNYWELAGGGSSEGELTLAGMMIDRADVTYRRGELCIRIEREA